MLSLRAATIVSGIDNALRDASLLLISHLSREISHVGGSRKIVGVGLGTMLKFKSSDKVKVQHCTVSDRSSDILLNM
jgi:hypothetical protein